MQPSLFASGGEVTGTPPEGFSYLPDLLNQDEQVALLRRVRDLDYQHDTFRGQRLKRAYVEAYPRA